VRAVVAPKHPLAITTQIIENLSEKVVALAHSFDGWANEALSELIVNRGSPRATIDPLNNSRSLGIVLVDHISTISA
jgi:hypothetical protein